MANITTSKPALRTYARKRFSTRRPSSISTALEAIGACVAAVILTGSAAAMLEDPSDKASAESRAALGASPSALALNREFTIGAYLGAPYHYPSDLKATKPGSHDFTIKDIEWYTDPFKHPLYYGVRLTQWPEGSRFGGMLDFTHSKAYAPLNGENTQSGEIGGKPLPERGRVGDLFKRLEFSHGHNMLTLNGLMRIARIGPRLQPYFGAGAGVSLPHSEVHRQPDNARTYEYQYTGPAGQALFGLEIKLGAGSLFLEYKFTAADYIAPLTGDDGSWLPLDLWRQFSRWWSGEPAPGGTVATQLVSHQIIGGFNIRVAGQPPVAPKP